MSDDNGKLDLTRRKVLGGLGGVGAGAALGGTGTMAFLSDTETSENNSVTAGQLDLKLDWFQKHYQGKKHGWSKTKNGLTNNPGPIFEVEDAKPGDCGYGYISVHNYHNPAYVWAGCDLKEWEMGRDEPEYHVDDTPKDGELAENIKVALLRYPYVKDTDAMASNQTDAHSQIEGEIKGARDFGSLGGCTPIFVTTLKDLCQNGLHNGHLLDGRPNKNGRCFYQSHTYFYAFAWWIPTTVGNEIQSDKAKFDLKFGAVQCRHVDNPEEHNPFAPEREVSTGTGFSDISFEKSLNMQALARGGSGRGEIQIHSDSSGVENNTVFGSSAYPDDTDVPFTAEIDPAAETASLTVNGETVTDDDVTDGDANGDSTGDPEWPSGVPSYIDVAINANSGPSTVTTGVKDVEVNGSSVSTSISEGDGTSYLAVTNVDASSTVTVEGTMRFEGDQSDYTTQDWVGIDFR